MVACLNGYEQMKFRDAAKNAFYVLTAAKDAYLLHCKNNPRKDLIETYLYWQLLLIYPICPHFGEVVYLDRFLQIVQDPTKYPAYLYQARFP